MSLFIRLLDIFARTGSANLRFTLSEMKLTWFNYLSPIFGCDLAIEKAQRAFVGADCWALDLIAGVQLCKQIMEERNRS